MSRRLRVLVALAVAGQMVQAAAAQARPAPPGLAGMREDLQRAQAVHERTVGTRIAYDLGLPVQAEPYFALTEADRARSRDMAEKQLLEEQARVTGLGVRLAAAQEKLAQSAQRVAQAIATGESAPTKAAPAIPTEPFAIVVDDAPAKPAEEPADRAAQAPVPAAGPPPVLLRGSQDHSRVGRALFFAKHYERARQELDAAVKQRPDLVDLFYLARSCEALSDTTAADELYLQVEVKDTTEVDGKKQPGAWARAARVARRQMQWMRDNGQWQPTRAIEAVPWRSR